jgi:hypothetical protein
MIISWEVAAWLDKVSKIGLLRTMQNGKRIEMKVATPESAQVCNELGEGSHGSGKRKRPEDGGGSEEKPSKTRRMEEVDL